MLLPSRQDSSDAIYLREIQAQFLSQLPDRLQELEDLWLTVAAGDGKAMAHLHRLAHTLTGESATFGFSRVHEIVQKLEASIGKLLAGANGTRQTLEQDVEHQIHDLRRASLRYAPDRLPHLPSRFRHGAVAAEEDKLVFLVDDDVRVAKAMAVQLRHYGYQVQVLTRLRDVAAQIRAQRPAALVVDIVMPEGKLAGPELVARLKRELEAMPKVVFASQRRDVEARLQALRAGGDAYFPKPVDVSTLAEKLDQLTGRQPEEPYEILIVDHDRDEASFFARIFKRAGMMATVLSDPLELLERIDAHRPDLILLDVHMPGCEGSELAAVLRQHEIYFTIPIVYLSNEKDVGVHVEALGRGGDDFLTKSIDPEHLVATVRCRAAYGRLLGSRLDRDGLTGLLNHSKLKERLALELKRASREGTPLAFAMLDIDRFKSINDVHGHAAGDRALATLAAMLKKRLRQTDVVARYGGDEFAVVLPGTRAPAAERLLDDVRASFAQLGHVAGDQRFTSTLSCGVAAYPRFDGVEQLSEAADRALLEAKRRGRNCVVRI